MSVVLPEFELFIYGAGGHARSLAETAHASGCKLLGFVDPNRAGESQLGFPIVGAVPRKTGPLALFVAIGDNFHRQRVAGELATAFPEALFPTLVHPSASVSKFAQISAHCCILQGAVVGSHAVVEEGSIINTAASVDHDCKLAPFSSIGPGARLGGSVSLGERSAVGIGASVRHAISIGRDSIIGAASYVHGNVGDELVYYGVPAIEIRERKRGDSYL